MDTVNSGRRKFFKQSSVLALLAAFGQVDSAFSNNLALLSQETGAVMLKQEDYMLDPSVIYLNHGSVGTIPKILHQAHVDYLSLCEANPWLYMWSEPWKEALVQTRNKVSKFVGCDSDELVFTHNTTEGFNFLAQGLSLTSDDEILFSSLNHPGASQCWFHHGVSRHYSVKQFEFPILETPNLTVADIVDIYAKQISDKTRVLVLPHIDNIVGLRHPVKEIAKMARAKGVEYIAVDGAQAIGMLPVSIRELGVDFYATSAHKWLQGPKGTGILYIKKSVQKKLRAMWVTWGQDDYAGTVRVFEDYGTRNLASVLTLGNAVDLQNKMGVGVLEAKRKGLWQNVMSSVDQHSSLDWRSSRQWNMSSSLYAIEIKNENSKQLFDRLFREHSFVFRPFAKKNWNTIRLSLNFFNTQKEIQTLFRLIA